MRGTVVFKVEDTQIVGPPGNGFVMHLGHVIDGELHVGIPGSAILKGNSKVLPISALASEPAGDFGVCC